MMTMYEMNITMLIILALILSFVAFIFYIKSQRQMLDRVMSVDVITNLQNRLERRATGRRDMNDIDIKLNDYISFSYTDGKPNIARVDWDREDCAFKAVVVRSGADCDAGNVLSFRELPKSGLEVIGNTLDNPDIEED